MKTFSKILLVSVVATIMALCTSCASFQPAKVSERQAIVQVLEQRGVRAEALDKAKVKIKGNRAEVYYWHAHTSAKTMGCTKKVKLNNDQGQWLVVSEEPHKPWQGCFGRWLTNNF